MGRDEAAYSGRSLGLYIHIPFCRTKCRYCNFYSLCGEEWTEDYYRVLSREIGKWSAQCREYRVDTVYFGGGTPPVLGSRRLVGILAQIRQAFNLAPDGEITLEANPNSITKADLLDLRRGGFNRISFGVQSAVHKELRVLGRKHEAADAEQALAWSREAGFENLSLDLMLGIPCQTPHSLEKTLEWVGVQGVDHVSAYILKVEEGTPLYRARESLDIPDEDLQADLYLLAADRLEKLGFRQYEISNFALPDSRSRHNLKYWNGEEYLGIGPSAHSFMQSRRFYYENDLQAFIEAAGAEEILTEAEGPGGGLEEYCMLRLRLAHGLSFQEARDRGLSQRQEDGMRARGENLQRYGLCMVDEERITLTRKGFLLSTVCTGELLEGLEIDK